MAAEGTNDDRKPVMIRTHKVDFELDLYKFEKHSEVIKKMHSAKKIPAVIDLTKYDVTAVESLCSYVSSEKPVVDLHLAAFAIGDLIELARLLRMETLQNALSELLLTSANRCPGFLLQALSIASKDAQLLASKTGEKLIEAAVHNFQQLARTQVFSHVPPNIMIPLLDRCDLPVENEFEVAEAALTWLAHRFDRLRWAYRVIRCVRVVNINQEQFAEVFKLAAKLPTEASMVSAFISYAFNHPAAFRVCALAEHAAAGYKRCGIRIDQHEYSLNMPTKRIFMHRKGPKKALYATAKPEKPKADEDSKIGDGTSKLECVRFAVTPQKKTTREERRKMYAENDKAKVEARKHSSKVAQAAREPQKELPVRLEAKEEKKERKHYHQSDKKKRHEQKNGKKTEDSPHKKEEQLQEQVKKDGPPTTPSRKAEFLRNLSTFIHGISQKAKENKSLGSTESETGSSSSSREKITKGSSVRDRAGASNSSNSCLNRLPICSQDPQKKVEEWLQGEEEANRSYVFRDNAIPQNKQKEQ